MSQRLGQHFLHNKKILERIAEALFLQSGDLVIEIGPGRGALTKELGLKIKDQGGRIIAIEKDVVLAKDLGLRIKDQGLEIIAGDALKVLPKITSELTNLQTYKLVGNIPYYITGHLFRIVGEMEHKPEVAVFMVQKEVAERISAKAPRFNLLAASVQVWADVEYLFSVSKKEFRPQPKVESAVVRMKPLRNYPEERRSRHGAGELSESTKNEYYKLVKILFKQPRKTILNNLCDGTKLPKAEILPLLQRLGLDERSRPQNLSVELITKLLQIC